MFHGSVASWPPIDLLSGLRLQPFGPLFRRRFDAEVGRGQFGGLGPRLRRIDLHLRRHTLEIWRPLSQEPPQKGQNRPWRGRQPKGANLQALGGLWGLILA